ncbi:MAG: hybrid sensor histidine kinase/response regulator [Ramlibacter sp.]
MNDAAASALLQAFADPHHRSAAADALAGALGARRVLVYVRDPELDAMLPAPGLPKTVAAGAGWREFLRRCISEPRPTARVTFPDIGEVTAQACCQDGACIVVLGDEVPASALDALAPAFPLLAALLRAQHALATERAEADLARESAARASELAQALDAARGAAGELNLQLRREHERKDEFLAILAHELRNPLSPLIASVEILRRSTAGADPHCLRQLEVMTRQLRQLTRLVDDLLDVSRVSRGMVELRRESVDLQEILEDALEIARPLIEARSQVLQMPQQWPDVVLNADRLRLGQVFANLLTNAAKYTEPGGRITVSVVGDESRVSVVIRDTGMGIPQDMLQRVFDLFAQAPMASVRANGGLGIGLTLVRRLVELHGGQVSAYSRGEGEGSTFTVTLPRARRRTRVAVETASIATASPAAPARVGEGLRVLVVDDNVDAAQSLAALLECHGAQARIAHDGQHAIEAARALDLHLVLLDIALPVMEGHETLRRLRQLDDFRAHVVALTGFASEADRQRSSDAGFEAHLVKPLAPEAVESLLARVGRLPA